MQDEFRSERAAESLIPHNVTVFTVGRDQGMFSASSFSQIDKRRLPPMSHTSVATVAKTCQRRADRYVPIHNFNKGSHELTQSVTVWDGTHIK